jgi:hypothetical protein
MMTDKQMSPDAMVGRIAALEWMVAQLYAVTLAGLTQDPKGFLQENREMIASKVPGWRLPSDTSVEAAQEVFDRIFSVAETNVEAIMKRPLEG